MLRERFDRIQVIDLRGNGRRGARAGVTGDTNVFDIQVGVAVTLAVADGSKAEGALAEVTYIDSWEADLFSREAKLAWLDEGGTTGTRPNSVPITRGILEDFRPIPFQVQQWPSLYSAFLFASSGLESKRDHLVYDINKQTLVGKLNNFLALSADEASNLFNPTGMNLAQDAIAVGVVDAEIRTAGYRPLDRRSHYYNKKWNDRPRTDLSRVWGGSNICLYALPNGTNAGPGVWCHALYPDRHAFRGSYGGYAFPLYDRRTGHGPLNISPALLSGLALAYAGPVSAEDAFDAMLALLSATSYTLRFAEDLEDVFPHVPFPATRAVFDRAAAVGREIRAVETFTRPPGPAFLTSKLASVGDHPTGVLGLTGGGTDDMRLCANGSGKVTGMPAAVWDFAVSGYRVLPRWLAARAGQPVDLALINEFRDITGRINELIHRFDEADLVLNDALDDSLTRDDLGLA